MQVVTIRRTIQRKSRMATVWMHDAQVHSNVSKKFNMSLSGIVLSISKYHNNNIFNCTILGIPSVAYGT